MELNRPTLFKSTCVLYFHWHQLCCIFYLIWLNGQLCIEPSRVVMARLFRVLQTQCDHMARFFVQYLAIYINENLPNKF